MAVYISEILIADVWTCPALSALAASDAAAAMRRMLVTPTWVSVSNWVAKDPRQRVFREESSHI